MAELVDQGMREGAVGLSSGLEYDVGSYSETSELVALARAAARHGGFYMTHIRDEADKSFEAFAEAIAIGEQGALPVQISHIKLGTVARLGPRTRRRARSFEEARAGAARTSRRTATRTTRGMRTSRSSSRTRSTTTRRACPRARGRRRRGEDHDHRLPRPPGLCPAGPRGDRRARRASLPSSSSSGW